jgi:Zinc dependent phospholipase C
MSGPYAHITLVHMFAGSKVDAIPDFPEEAKQAYLNYLRFSAFGSISPDYPCFSLSERSWADIMHQVPPGEMNQSAAKKLKNMGGQKKQKCFAWFLGYMAHVATDLTIHPVVQKVASGFPLHSICEIHQDVWIFDRLHIGEIHRANVLSGINGCFSRGNGYELDPDIDAFWSDLLQEVYPAHWNNSRPHFSEWHKSFGLVVDNILSGNMTLFGRHTMDGIYPDRTHINDTYIKKLPVPIDGSQDYNQIFDRAIESTEKLWSDVAKAVFQDNNQLSGNWSLDTGLNQANQLVFWG